MLPVVIMASKSQRKNRSCAGFCTLELGLSSVIRWNLEITCTSLLHQLYFIPDIRTAQFMMLSPHFMSFAIHFAWHVSCQFSMKLITFIQRHDA